MRHITFLLVGVATVAGIVAYMRPASGQTNGEPTPVFVTKIPPEYRDFRLISVAHEEGKLNSLGAVLGNDVAIKAYRERTLPYPDGTIIAALHYTHSPSEKTTESLARRNLSFPAPPRTFSLWLRIHKNTPRPVAGGSDTSARTANPAPRPYND